MDEMRGISHLKSVRKCHVKCYGSLCSRLMNNEMLVVRAHRFFSLTEEGIGDYVASGLTVTITWEMASLGISWGRGGGKEVHWLTDSFIKIS